MAKRKRELTPEQQLAQQIYATLKPQTVGDVTEGLKKIWLNHFSCGMSNPRQVNGDSCR